MDDIKRSLDYVSGRANRTRRNLIDELLQDLEQIEDNAALFRRGRNSAYQAVAIQLRNLLLKGRRGLVDRTLPAASFHVFRRPSVELPSPDETPDDAKHGIVIFDARGPLKLQTGGGSHIELEFDNDTRPLPLGRWLDQWIIRPDITVRNLIQRMADEEVAHTQEEIDPVIQRAEGFLLSEGRYERRVPTMAIVALGEYVANRIREQLAELHGPERN